MKKALFVSDYTYPDGDAGALRVHSLSALFAECGFRCDVLAMGRPGGLDKSGHGSVTTLRTGSGTLARIGDRLLLGHRVRRFLDAHGGEYTHIVFSHLALGTTLSVQRYAKRNGQTLVHDSVEWYSRQEFKCGFLDYRYVENDFLNRWVVRRPMKVIAISSYLHDHFRSRGCEVVRIPVILDMDRFSPKKRVVLGRTGILYAGSPGKKDSLERIVNGYLMLTEHERERISLRIVGIEMRKLLALCGHTDSESIRASGIVARARVSHAEVLEELARADFTILIREDDQRHSKAGFPTKVVESLACATPVICNDTSDIFEYLEDQVNAIRVEGKGAVEIANAIRVAAGIGVAARRALFANARKCAERHFSPEQYHESLCALLADDQ